MWTQTHTHGELIPLKNIVFYQLFFKKLFRRVYVPFYILPLFLFLSHFSKSSHFKPILAGVPCILLFASLFIKGWWDGGTAVLYVFLTLVVSLEDRERNERTVEYLPCIWKSLCACLPCLCTQCVCVCVWVRLWPHQLLPADHGAPAFLADTIPLSYWSLSNPPLTDALSHWPGPEFSTLKAVLNIVCVCLCVYVWVVMRPWKMQLLTLWARRDWVGGRGSPSSLLIEFQIKYSTCCAEPLINSCTGVWEL